MKRNKIVPYNETRIAKKVERKRKGNKIQPHIRKKSFSLDTTYIDNIVPKLKYTLDEYEKKRMYDPVRILRKKNIPGDAMGIIFDYIGDDHNSMIHNSKDISNGWRKIKPILFNNYNETKKRIKQLKELDV